MRLIIVRASDVPTYVQYGAADLGIAGKDVLLEHGGDGLYQPLDLRHRALPHDGGGAATASTTRARCARARGCAWRPSTCRTAREHFAAKGVHVDLIKLYGSMELAPLVGLADAIVDLVSTGNTLQGQRIWSRSRRSCRSRSRLVVNQAALKLKRAAAAAAASTRSQARCARPMR